MNSASVKRCSINLDPLSHFPLRHVLIKRRRSQWSYSRYQQSNRSSTSSQRVPCRRERSPIAWEDCQVEGSRGRDYQERSQSSYFPGRCIQWHRRRKYGGKVLWIHWADWTWYIASYSFLNTSTHGRPLRWLQMLPSVVMRTYLSVCMIPLSLLLPHTYADTVDQWIKVSLLIHEDYFSDTSTRSRWLNKDSGTDHGTFLFCWRAKSVTKHHLEYQVGWL